MALLDTEDEQKTSASLTDTDVTEESSTSTDGNEDSSTSTQEPETAVDAISESLGLKDDDEGSAEGETEGDDAEDGKEEAKDGEGKDAKPDEEDAKKDEEDLYKEPEGLKEQAQKRFHTLVESHKEVSSQLAERDETIGEFRQMIDSSGASPEEFTELLRYSQMAKSGDLEGALALLDQQREALAQALGKPLPGIDLLADFPDLRDQVDDYKITEEHALELATARRNDARIAQHRRQQDEQHHEAETREQAVNSAANDITKLADNWKANDIDYPAKHERLMERAAVIAQKYPASEWATMLEDYYNMLSAAGPTGGNKNPTPRPLRPGGGGGGNKEPSNAADAVSQALGLGD